MTVTVLQHKAEAFVRDVLAVINEGPPNEDVVRAVAQKVIKALPKPARVSKPRPDHSRRNGEIVNAVFAGGTQAGIAKRYGVSAGRIASIYGREERYMRRMKTILYDWQLEG
jgi:hypothetical protein